MRPTRIDQVVPSFSGRDAIGVHMTHVRDLLRARGFESDIWCEGTFPDVRSQCRLLTELPARPRPGTWWLYHLSSGSPVADLIRRRPEPTMLDYHNITPGELFGPWVPWAVEEAASGRKQLDDMIGATFFAFADSIYNEAELRDRGCTRTRVVPPMFDARALESGADRDTLAARREERAEGGADWLFVGRVTPSKAQHDLIKALACYRRFHDPRARLHLVGSWMGDDYPRALRRFASGLGLGAAVHLTGPVPEPALAAYYATADVFVCASEHEGFCVPVVEAMHLGVPVVALAATAVTETAADAALLLDDKSPMALSTAVHRVLSDATLRGRLVEAGRARAHEFSLDRSRQRWAAAIDEAIGAYGGGSS
ncbi:MAG TPA: glycosyltransferase family 4 protein [Acidimicrobiales bacterium]|nr:glycosyltransferase family 4 protein [Acidimicrobiales bacterium]